MTRLQDQPVAVLESLVAAMEGRYGLRDCPQTDSNAGDPIKLAFAAGRNAVLEDVRAIIRTKNSEQGATNG